MHEFDLIKRFFTRYQPAPSGVLVGIGDDAAVIAPELNKNYVMTTDSLIYGVHFDDHMSPYALGHKLAAVNLSDLAAMGAVPRYALLTLTLPTVDADWLQKFSDGLFDSLNKYSVVLIGGNTARGPLNLNLQLTGTVNSTSGIRRNGAKPGDHIYVSGLLGAASFAWYLQKEAMHPELIETFSPFLHYPNARVQLGQALNNLATAAIDISDGLLADLSHICNMSHCGARIHIEKLPLFNGWQSMMPFERAIEFALCGGEDYELCFTVNSQQKNYLQEISAQCHVPCHVIGEIIDTEEIEVLYQDKKFEFTHPIGFQHF